MFLKPLAIIFLSSIAMANVVTVDTSVKCDVTDADTPIKTFNFDLYATGFPMAGVSMFSGMFEAEAPGLNCKTQRGFINSGLSNGHLMHSASSNCLQNISYELKTNANRYERGTPYVGSLTIRIAQLLAPPEENTYNVTCKLD